MSSVLLRKQEDALTRTPPFETSAVVTTPLVVAELSFTPTGRRLPRARGRTRRRVRQRNGAHDDLRGGFDSMSRCLRRGLRLPRARVGRLSYEVGVTSTMSFVQQHIPVPRLTFVINRPNPLAPVNGRLGHKESDDEFQPTR
jgi:hypothetical protein